MSAWVAWRIAKWTGVLLFGAGCLGSALARDPRDRAMFAYGLATAGWLLTWIAGYGMLKATGVSMGAPWVSAGMGLSFVALLGAVLRAQGVVPALTGGVAVGGVLASTAVMALRAEPLAHAWSGGVGLVAAILVGGALTLRGEHGEPASASAAHAWFAWLGRLEGLSLLALFGVYMPAKYIAHVELDGGQGWFGWVHGMLFVSYVVALISAARIERWSIGWAALGFVASLLPFGTFAFEAKNQPRK